jgi:hypothetical protein
LLFGWSANVEDAADVVVVLPEELFLLTTS